MKSLLRAGLLSVIASIAVLCQFGQAQEKQSRERAREIVQARLGTLKGANHGELLDVKADVLGKLFGACHFFALRFRQYPVAIATEPPLKTNNLFVVCGDTVTHMTDEQQLADFFKKSLAATSGETVANSAVEGWLVLAQELHKDGFFEFERPSVKASNGASTGDVAVVAKRGDKGRLTVKLEFAAGKLTKITPGGKVIPGIRPRCQATKLLDQDPIIREVMRRDILVMGRACKPYLDQVRATAAPDLLNVIDDLWQQILDEERQIAPQN